LLCGAGAPAAGEEEHETDEAMRHRHSQRLREVFAGAPT
jgi:hypothetical protein